MFDTATLLVAPAAARRAPGRDRRATAAGPGILAADACVARRPRGARAVARHSRPRCAAITPPGAASRNPVDLVASAGADVYEEAVRRARSTSGEVDAVVVLFVSPLVTEAADVERAIVAAAAPATARVPNRCGVLPRCPRAAGRRRDVPTAAAASRRSHSPRRPPSRSHAGRASPSGGARPEGAVPALPGIDLDRARDRREQSSPRPPTARWLDAGAVRQLLDVLRHPDGADRMGRRRRRRGAGGRRGRLPRRAQGRRGRPRAQDRRRRRALGPRRRRRGARRVHRHARRARRRDGWRRRAADGGARRRDDRRRHPRPAVRIAGAVRDGRYRRRAGARHRGANRAAHRLDAHDMVRSLRLAVAVRLPQHAAGRRRRTRGATAARRPARRARTRGRRVRLQSGHRRPTGASWSTSRCGSSARIDFPATQWTPDRSTYRQRRPTCVAFGCVWGSRGSPRRPGTAASGARADRATSGS